MRTPDHNAPVTGGMKRNDPIGGDAYGMPLNASTGSKCRPSKCTITPDTEPYFVCTTRDDNCTVSAPMPPKLVILLLLLLLLLLLAAAFDVLPLSPLLLLIPLFMLLVLLLLLPLLNSVEINRRNISLIIMNVSMFFFLQPHRQIVLTIYMCSWCCTKTHTRLNWFLFDFSLGNPFIIIFLLFAQCGFFSIYFFVLVNFQSFQFILYCLRCVYRILFFLLSKKFFFFCSSIVTTFGIIFCSLLSTTISSTKMVYRALTLATSACTVMHFIRTACLWGVTFFFFQQLCNTNLFAIDIYCSGITFVTFLLTRRLYTYMTSYVSMYQILSLFQFFTWIRVVIFFYFTVFMSISINWTQFFCLN